MLSSHVLLLIRFDFHFIPNFAELSPAQNSLLLLDPLTSTSSWCIWIPPSTTTWISLMLPSHMCPWLKAAGKRIWGKALGWKWCATGSTELDIRAKCLSSVWFPNLLTLKWGKCFIQIGSIITVKRYIEVCNYQECVCIHLQIHKHTEQQTPFLNEIPVSMQLSPCSCRKPHAETCKG